MEIDTKRQGSSVVVYRPTGAPITVSGGSIRVDVKDGALMVSSGANVLFVLASGQWLTVNADPAHKTGLD
jgi:hypothetical protein